MDKRLIRLALAISMFALALAGCAAERATSVSFDGGTLRSSGKTLTIELEGNPTTGFTWTSQIEGDNLSLESEDYTSSSKDPHISGAGGVFGYRYEGAEEGASTITCTYRRPWEDYDPLKTFVFEVTTDSSGNITDARVAA